MEMIEYIAGELGLLLLDTEKERELLRVRERNAPWGGLSFELLT